MTAPTTETFSVGHTHPTQQASRHLCTGLMRRCLSSSIRRPTLRKYAGNVYMHAPPCCPPRRRQRPLTQAPSASYRRGTFDRSPLRRMEAGIAIPLSFLIRARARSESLEMRRAQGKKRAMETSVVLSKISRGRYVIPRSREVMQESFPPPNRRQATYN